MVPKKALILCLLIVIGALCVEAQRDGRRRSGRRKPTTESPPPDEEPENEKNPQKLDTELDTIAKSSSAQPTETETNIPPADKEATNGKDSGPPSIVPRGTRKPRPHVRNSGEPRPRPTLPSFARKRGPKPERREFKQNDENSVVSPSSTSTTPKPSRGSSRNRGNNTQDRNSTIEKVTLSNDEAPTEAPAKRRFGGGPTRRQSRGNRRFNPTNES